MIKKSILCILALLLVFAVTGFSAVKNEDESNLAPGNYYLTAKFKLEDNEEPVEKTDRVSLTYHKNQIILHNEKQKEFPIVGQIKNKIFTARLDDANGIVEFIGELKTGNKVAGKMSGQNKKGTNKLSGIFELIPEN